MVLLTDYLLFGCKMLQHFSHHELYEYKLTLNEYLHNTYKSESLQGKVHTDTDGDEWSSHLGGKN